MKFDITDLCKSTEKLQLNILTSRSQNTRGNGNEVNIHNSGANPSRLVRSNSDQTLSTLVESSESSLSRNEGNDSATGNDVSDLASVFTSGSEETLTNHPVNLMGRSITAYSWMKQIPIVSTFLHSGVLVFKSANSFEKYQMGEKDDTFPILQTVSSKLSIFKKSSPIMTILRYKSSVEKYEFCKVYFKIYSTHINYYVLKFNYGDDVPEETVILLNNNSNKPTVDFEYLNSKFRIVGVTGTSSTFGTNGLIKIFVMKEKADLLTRDVTVINPNDHNKTKIKIGESNSLYKVIERQEKSNINERIDSEQPLVNIPLGCFVDEGNIKLEKNFMKNGTIKLFDYQVEHSEESLKMICILLVLREQEYRKYKGDNKPTYV
ncbi:uncharacterized protein RJT20DRAFT_133683 [Scheffersomyces xylosifermentans]|uniref:uncharacterized protein n=1 Tax=Scheffersomyces xylosifermentans TaxID=1304137 RepID=UPI00315DD904